MQYAVFSKHQNTTDFIACFSLPPLVLLDSMLALYHTYVFSQAHFIVYTVANAIPFYLEIFLTFCFCTLNTLNN